MKTGLRIRESEIHQLPTHIQGSITIEAYQQIFNDTLVLIVKQEKWMSYMVTIKLNEADAEETRVKWIAENVHTKGGTL